MSWFKSNRLEWRLERLIELQEQLMADLSVQFANLDAAIARVAAAVAAQQAGAISAADVQAAADARAVTVNAISPAPAPPAA